MQTFFAAQAPLIAQQVNRARAHTVKADLTREELEALDQVLAAIDFAGWVALAGDVSPLLDEIVRDGAYAALGQVQIDTSADPAIADVVNADALAYAEERSAEMVGMRRNLAGDLVENPDARWRIDESTRDFLRDDVGTAMREGWSNERLAAQIADSYAFSKDRAMTIARTETQMASNGGAVNGYRASGVVDGKIWLTAEDDLVSEECQENGDAGVIGLDDTFPSGDDAPPVHPNCRCSIAPFIDFDNEES